MSIHVALATDAAYLPWCATAVRSCLDATPAADLDFHLFHDQPIPTSGQDRLTAMVRSAGSRAHWHPVEPERLAMLPSKGPALGGRTSWIRVVMPDLLPDLERLIYLDADTLVLKSLAPLWTTELAGAPIAAVANIVEPEQRDRVRELGLDPAAYFNAGVLVMDLASMRRSNAVRALVAVAVERADRLRWYDQDALNVTFTSSWLALHPRWNAQNSLRIWEEWAGSVFGREPLAEALAAPAIVHFEGPAVVKPWHLLGDHPLRPRYLATLASTPWADEPLVGRTLLNQLIAHLPLERRLPAYLATERARLRAAGALRRVKAVAGRRRRPPA